MIRKLAVAAALFATATGASTARAQAASCSNRIGAITVPAGFCIEQVADSLNGLRHIAVAANGDLYAAAQGGRGGLIVLHDSNNDGRYDVRTRLYAKGGNDIVLRGPNLLYYTTNDAVLRITTQNADEVVRVDTIVEGLPTGGHTTKSIAFDNAGALYVDIGSPSNTCQVADRTARSPGKDPCPELDTRAGVWKFSATRSHQTQKDGSRYATGLRNVVALTSHPTTGVLYGVQHGRDQLADNWGYTAEQSAEIPSEILGKITEGSDFGWPYCYHDRFQNKTLLAPEYGGDGKTVGRCASKTQPIAAYPGHWAPESIVFYNGTAFPAQYRGGAFISFHGSWNRSPLPQAGFNVIYQPFSGASAGGAYTVFAEGFDKEKVGNNTLRPMGLAVGPDGSLYIGSDTGARVWRVRPAARR